MPLTASDAAAARECLSMFTKLQLQTRTALSGEKLFHFVCPGCYATYQQ